MAAWRREGLEIDVAVNLSAADILDAELGDEVFFFQAEDGIRAHCVTGVQTCALPIFFSGVMLASHHSNVSDFSSGSVDSDAFRKIRPPGIDVALKIAVGARFWLRRKTVVWRSTSAGSRVGVVSTNTCALTSVILS